jgi:hypothetical protein
MRVALDPIAEHLVARSQVETLGANEERWQAFLDELRRNNCPSGFLDSLRACLDHRVYGRSVPTSVRRQLIGLDPLQREVA